LGLLQQNFTGLMPLLLPNHQQRHNQKLSWTALIGVEKSCLLEKVFSFLGLVYKPGRVTNSKTQEEHSTDYIILNVTSFLLNE